VTELLTVAEVAALLRVSTWTVAQMTRDGRLPKVPMLRRIRIPRSAVEALTQGVYDEANEPLPGVAMCE
jgi:excisionase family DNA binding protein